MATAGASTGRGGRPGPTSANLLRSDGTAGRHLGLRYPLQDRQAGQRDEAMIQDLTPFGPLSVFCI
jgi:hypothetical protein